jgi:predicted TIM-barrel fold metal-dependent hydrolase
MIDVHTHAQQGWNLDTVGTDIETCGFEKAFLLASPIDHWGSDLNPGCAELVEAFPDKLLGLVGIHPPDIDQSLRDIETYGKKGFIGVKLMPTVGYYPDDERFRPIFQEINNRKWIVLTHCGWCSPGEKDKDLPQSTRFTDPYHVEPLARIFPETDFILAHGGGRTFFPRAAELTHYHDNVYIDTCPGQGTWILRHGGIWLGVLDWKRVLFGTDLFLGREDHAEGYRDKIHLTESLVGMAGYGEHTAHVMHDNAARLLCKHGVDI